MTFLWFKCEKLTISQSTLLVATYFLPVKFIAAHILEIYFSSLNSTTLTNVHINHAPKASSQKNAHTQKKPPTFLYIKGSLKHAMKF